MKLNIYFLGIALLFSSSWIVAQSREASFEAEHMRLYKDVQKIQVQIRELIGELDEEKIIEIDGEKIYNKKVLEAYYHYSDFEPAWKDHEALQQAIQAIKGSFDDGLLPEDYHTDVLISIVEKIKASENKGKVDYEWVAKFDLLMTDAILLYAYHLLEGKVDPHELDVQWNFGYADLPGGDGKRLAEAINNKEVLRALHSLRPQIPGYQKLMDELAKYRLIAETGAWTSIEPGGKIDPGDIDKRIIQVRKRLEISGDLTDLSNMLNDAYDVSLEEDILHFQERHGLDNDGIIGKGTFAALNVPVEDRIDQIKVNLERYRWVTHNLTENFLVVNIANFKAYVVRDSKLIHSTNVMVGTYYNKTPVFKSQLKYIEFNPTWTVPRSITVKEMISKILKNHNYLQDHNMALLDASGNIVPMTFVDLDAISVNNFPYTIRQEPGPGNALGEVKFIFPNKYSVYLHDTPSKYLFGKASRSFSHGCIRTQNPIDLAEVLLEGSEWDGEKIQQTLDSKKTTRAYLDDPLDVLLLYWTVGIYQDQSIFFFPDIYKRDPKILEGLQKDVENVMLK